MISQLGKSLAVRPFRGAYDLLGESAPRGCNRVGFATGRDSVRE